MTEQTAPSSRWGQDRRLEFIDFRLLWEGRLNRSDLTNFFRISVPQASLDLARYQELAPNNLSYDRTLKTYVASSNFKPILANFDSTHYLNELLLREHGSLAPTDSFIGWAPPVASLPSPVRKVEPEILIGLVRALQKKQMIEIDYLSLTSFDEAATRTIYPLSFAHDGFRWHIRAYCFKSSMFKDYVLGRIKQIIRFDTPSGDIPEDIEWDTFIDVVIGPNPTYAPLKRLAIEHDYQMKNGEAKIRTRKAQLFYLKKRLNLDITPDRPINDAQQIVMLRIEESTAK